MSLTDVILVFVGIPASVVFLVAVPVFGHDWWDDLRAVAGRARPRSKAPTDDR